MAVLVVTAWLVVRLVEQVGWEEIETRLAAASPSLIALAVVALVAQLSFWAWRLGLAVRRIGSAPPPWAVYLSLLATAALNLLIPFVRFLSGVMRARYLAHHSSPRTPMGIFYGAVLFDQAANFVLMVGITAAGLVVGALLTGEQALAVAVSVVLGVLALGVWWWLRRRGDGHPAAGLLRFLERRARATDGLPRRLASGGRSVVEVFFRLGSQRPLLVQATLLGVALFGSVCLAQWAVFQAVGASVSPVLVFVALALGLTAGVLLGTPGGLGTTEATMIALYAAFGVPEVDAVSGVLLFRGLHYLTVLMLGLPAVAFLELRRPERDPDEEIATPELGVLSRSLSDLPEEPGR